MSKYICSACQREYDEDYGFCHECGGRLVEKEKNDPALNLGDANAISGGVSINQSKNISTQETHYHSTTVERVKSESELKLEATNQLRAKAEEIMAERGRIDSVAMNQLRPLSKQLGIDEETFKSIIKDVRSNRNGAISGLSAANARYLQQAQLAVKTNDMDALSNLTPRLEAMAAISQDDNVQFMYYLTLSILYPIKSMEVYERQMDENYWRTFWAIISYIRTGKHAEATKVLALFDPLRYEKSEEDQNLLEAYFNIMKEDKDGAQEFLDEILGEPTEQVKPLLRAVESTLYEEEPESLEVRFYMERVMSKSDVVVKSQKKTETPASKEEPTPTAPKPEKKAVSQPKTKAEDVPAPEIKKDNKEAEELFAKACAASGAKRVMLLQKAADAGSLEAMYDLADCYDDGEGVEKNMPLAIKWITKAADAGYVKAQTTLGAAYFQGMEGLDQNYALSEKYLMMAAEKENVDAQIFLASLYGTMEDYGKALIWARKAAQMDNAQAYCILGRIYDEGLGVEVDHKEGLKWYEKAANGGDADAQNIVGKIYSVGEFVAQDDKKAFNNFQLAAAQGHIEAMACLGYCYQEGFGTDINIQSAEEWFKKAADGGFADAQNALGNLYSDIIQDYQKALEYYQMAANQGQPYGMFNLGLYYLNGIGVEANFPMADEWIRKAADAGLSEAIELINSNNPSSSEPCAPNAKGIINQADTNNEFGIEQNEVSNDINIVRKLAKEGNSDAMVKLGLCYHEGNGVKQNDAEAAKWFKRASDLGNAEAHFQLGEKYLNSYGVVQNFEEAAKWYRKAAKLNHREAMYKLGLMYQKGQGVVANIKKSEELIKSSADLGFQEAIDFIGSNNKKLKETQQKKKNSDQSSTEKVELKNIHFSTDGRKTLFVDLTIIFDKETFTDKKYVSFNVYNGSKRLCSAQLNPQLGKRDQHVEIKDVELNLSSKRINARTINMDIKKNRKVLVASKKVLNLYYEYHLLGKNSLEIRE